MMNYFNYILKYQTPARPLPSTGDKEKDLELERKRNLYTNDRPLSGTDPVGDFVVSGAVLGPLVNWVGKGIGYLGSKVLSKMKPATNITERFFKFIGKSPNQKQQSITFTQGQEQEKLLFQQLQEAGVDVSKLTLEDLQTALNKRAQIIKSSGPKSYTIVEPDKTFGNTVTTLKDIRQGDQVGQMVVLDTKDPYLHIAATDNFGKGAHNVSEKMLNSATEVAKTFEKKGVVTGEELLSPEITVEHVWPKFDKKLIGNYGEQYWSKHTRLPDKQGTPVYSIETPTQQVSTKSIIFDPHVIDALGKMKIDWNDGNIYKVIVPTGAVVGEKAVESHEK